MTAIPNLGSDLERAFDTEFHRLAPDLPKPVAGFAFHEHRRWAFDRAWPVHKVAVELEGGGFGRRIICHNCGAVVRSVSAKGIGRELRAAGYHGHPARFVADAEKYNAAALDGWLLLRFTHEDITGDPFRTVETIRQALEQRAWAAHAVEPLTAHQDRILHLIAGGFTAMEIALRLDATEASVRKQATSMCEKLEARNRPSLVARSYCAGLLDPSRIAWAWDQVVLGVLPAETAED